MGEMLSVKNINVFYGSIQALRDISFHVNEGEIVTLIGANGAGKTTTLHAISGLLKVQSGEIDYCGQNISKMASPQDHPSGPGPGAGRPPCLQRADRYAEPADGCLHPPRRQRGHPERLRYGLCICCRA